MAGGESERKVRAHIFRKAGKKGKKRPAFLASGSGFRTLWEGGRELLTQQEENKHKTKASGKGKQNGKKDEKESLDSTSRCSRVVPHPSTYRTQTALTSVFG